MSDGGTSGQLFDAASSELSEVAGFSVLEARGILRQVLKSAGLRPELLTRSKLQIVFERILPRALPGFDPQRAVAIGRELATRVAQMPEGAGTDPDALFHRVNREV